MTNNICEVFGQHGYVRTAYAYAPYGSVTSDGDATQPLQWSSEYADTELGLTYYNYRHYNPTVGRWLERDVVEFDAKQNRYTYVDNTPMRLIDFVGGLSSDPLSAAWTEPTVFSTNNSRSSNPISGGAVTAANQLIYTGNLREEYTRRSLQIPTDLSEKEQERMRSNLKEEIRSRSNSFSKSCLNEIDKERELKIEEARKNGRPAPYRRDHAQSTNKDVNRFAKHCKIAGKACFVVSVTVEGCNIATAPEGEKLKETTRAGGRLGGGLLVGTATGAVLGAAGANPVTVLVGAIIGGVVGSIGGEKAVDEMWDRFD